jgi:hypothetical protein
MRRMAAHANGMALIFARTETTLFFETVWHQASAVLFIRGRLFFHRPDGRRTLTNAGAPSCLVAYGARDAAILERCSIDGHFVGLGPTQRQDPAERHMTLWEAAPNNQASSSESPHG